MEQVINTPVKQVKQELTNSMLFSGQTALVYGRELSRPSSVDVEVWLGSRISDMSWADAEEHLYKAELKHQREQMQKLAGAMQEWVDFVQTQYGYTVAKVKAVFDDDPEDGKWFVGLERVFSLKDESNQFRVRVIGMLLESTLYELAKRFDVAEYRNGEYRYDPADWWSPTMVAMKLAEE